jgi:glyoxylase-like metal-dependent hydrolase (beta-lactamase superfamily II)
LYELSYDAGGYPDKMIASVGDDGLLLVDTGERHTGKALADTLAAFGKGMPRIVINTHSHIEHLGGNPVVGRSAVIVAHRNVRERYLNGLYAFGDFPAEALPNLTFTDSLTIHFNGEDIRLLAFPGAHDDSDILVWFTKSRVAVVGALCMGQHFPSIDLDTGDIRHYPEVTRRLLAYLPEDVTLVPAHAADCTMAQGRLFLDMLEQTSAIVRRERARGKDLARLKREDALAAYRSFESSYVKRNTWLTWWYDAYQSPRPSKTRPYAPVLRALRSGGAKAAVDEYSRLRRARPGEYWFDDMGLMYMGRRLARLKRDADAIMFLDRCIAEYPGSEGEAQSHNVLSVVYARTGDSTRAVEHASAYLEKHPEDEDARRRLAKLAPQGDEGRRP